MTVPTIRSTSFLSEGEGISLIVRILTGSSFNPSAENTCPTKLTPGTQSFSFFRLNFNPTSLFLSSSSSQLLIRIRLMFTMYQKIIHYNLHRNPFKEFVHLPLVDFRGRRDAKRELCKSISTPGGSELSSSTGRLPVSTTSIKGHETLCN